MSEGLRALAAVQHDVFSTADAYRYGFDDRAIARAVYVKHWVRIRRGFFVHGEVWAQATPVARHLYVARAVVRSCGGNVVLSHITGALALGIVLLDPELSVVHVTRLDGRHGRLEHGVLHHRGPVDRDACLAVDDELLVAPTPMTVFGAMCLGSLDQAVVIGDSALNKGLVTDSELEREAVTWLHVPNTRTARFARLLLDGGAASAGESVGRQLFWHQRVPRPETQVLIRGPRGQTAYVDWYWREAKVVGEFDGKMKYRRDGAEGEDPGEIVFREKQREDWLLETDEVRFVRRMVWADIFRPEQTAARFREAIRRGLRGEQQ